MLISYQNIIYNNKEKLITEMNLLNMKVIFLIKVQMN